MNRASCRLMVWTSIKAANGKWLIAIGQTDQTLSPLSPESRPMFLDALNRILEGTDRSGLKADPLPNSSLIIFTDKDAAQIREYAPPLRRHSILSASDVPLIIKYIRTLEGNFSGSGMSIDPTVWISPTQIIVLFRSDCLNDRATLVLKPSRDMQLVSSLPVNESGGPRLLNQQQLLRLVRTSLVDCFANTIEQQQWVSRLKNLNRNSTLDVGKQANSALSGDGQAWPDLIELWVRAIDDTILENAAKHRIRVHLEINPQNGTFELIPVPADIDKAFIADARLLTEYVNAALADDDAAVFLGSPDEPDAQ